MPFKQGDMPAGQYPQFQLTDNTPCPATIWGVTSWPDGSMKWCGAMIRVPTTIAGSGTLTINVKSGGSAPAASSRGTSDFTAADLKTELTGVTNLTGLWTASLNTAITDATDIVVLGDGPAGKLYRIGGPCKQSGSAHGQLHAWHYVLAMQNTSAGLLGLRYLGKISQPWVDVASPAPDRRVMTGVLKSGAATIRTLQGHDTTGTVGANLGMDHYTSFFTAGTDAKWDYVQGGGSAAADCTVRVAHSKTYFVKSRLLPPYDLTGTITDSSSVDYYPYGDAGMQLDVAGTGERDDIGVFPSWVVRHLNNQSTVSERRIRAVGLASGGWQQIHRRSSTGQIVAVHDAAATYTGLGTVQPTWRARGSGLYTGVSAPATQASRWQSEFESSHRPAATFYPYLVTGEPQYLDLLVEQANGLNMSAVPGSRSKRVTGTITRTNTDADSSFGERDVIIGATTYKGGGLLFAGGLTRIQAWWYRDLAQAAAIYPDTCPYGGTQTRKYFRDQVSQSALAMNDYNSRFGSGWSTFGWIGYDDRVLEAKPWCHGYLSNAICHASAIVPSTEVTALRQFVAQFWENAADQLDIGTVYSYEGSLYDQNDLRATQFSDMLFGFGGNLAFATGTNRGTLQLTQNSALNSVNPTNGDVFAFTSGYKPFTGVGYFQRLYAVNCTGNTMQLSLTPGGAAITVDSAGSTTSWIARMASLAPVLTSEGNIGPAAYIASINGAIQHHKALGDAVADASTESAARVASGGVSYSGDPKNFMAAAYPA